jgi:hypothetical protein
MRSSAPRAPMQCSSIWCVYAHDFMGAYARAYAWACMRARACNETCACQHERAFSAWMGVCVRAWVCVRGSGWGLPRTSSAHASRYIALTLRGSPRSTWSSGSAHTLTHTAPRRPIAGGPSPAGRQTGARGETALRGAHPRGGRAPVARRVARATAHASCHRSWLAVVTRQWRLVSAPRAPPNNLPLRRPSA